MQIEEPVAGRDHPTYVRNKVPIFLLAVAPLLAEKFPLNPSPLAPATAGTVDVGEDSDGNTTMNIHVEHLSRPGELSPPKTTYVVWAQAPDRPPENIGVLNVAGDLKADLKTLSPLHNFQLIVTAEDHTRATEPNGPVMLSANIRQKP